MQGGAVVLPPVAASDTPPQGTDRGPGRPPGSKNKTGPAIPGVTAPDEPLPPLQPASKDPLTAHERAVFIEAVITVSEMIDEGLWHLGLDSDPEMPDLQGHPGIPIWTMDRDEAEVLTDVLIEQGKRFPVIYGRMRQVIGLYHYLQAGMILASRMMETVLRLFQNGLNMRFSKKAYLRELEAFEKEGGAA